MTDETKGVVGIKTTKGSEFKTEGGGFYRDETGKLVYGIQDYSKSNLKSLNPSKDFYPEGA